MIIGPLTEVTGRRYTYIFSHMFFVLTFLLLALKVSLGLVRQSQREDAHLVGVLEQHRTSSDRTRDLGDVW